MTTMLNIYDLNRKKTAVLQNAYNITETQELNQIYSLTFEIPADDPKTEYIRGFHYARYGEDGELYRIIKIDPEESDTSVLKVSCEHVIATLCDKVMFGSITYGGKNVTAAQTIRYLLGKQSDWALDQCDFSTKYEYNWEQENILNALFSIPKEFVSPYKWVYNTKSYPWKISLKKIDVKAKPEYYIRARLNLLSSSSTSDYAEICTRLYPLGYGEGVNQLTIKDVNNGVAYIEAPADVVAQYGIRERVLADRSFESAETLKAFAETTLSQMQTPSYTKRFEVTDLYPITSDEIDNAQVGKLCKLTLDGTVVYITKTTRVLDEAGNLQIDLSTKATDVASTVADLADRVRIESVYSQGATQLYQHSKDANATPEKGMIISLYFPSEMKQINKVLLRMQLKKFRAYSQTTESGGGSTQTSSGGEMSGSTSSMTGYSSISGQMTSSEVWAQEGGNVFGVQIGNSSNSYTINTTKISPYYTETSLPTSTEFDDHIHYIYTPFPHEHSVVVTGLSGSIFKSALAHSHTIQMTSGMTSHAHTFSFGSHTHDVTIPAHKHNIAAGIFESGSPTGFDIYVGNKKKATVNETTYEGDITSWLLNNKNQVPRGTWIDIEIRPNDLAYVVSSVFVQGFVQSRGGGNY